MGIAFRSWRTLCHAFLSDHRRAQVLNAAAMAAREEKPLHSLAAGATAGAVEAYVSSNFVLGEIYVAHEFILLSTAS